MLYVERRRLDHVCLFYFVRFECAGGVLSAEVNLQAETALIRVRKATAKKGTGDALANALTQSGFDSSCRNMSDGSTKARRPYDVTEVMREKQQERYESICCCCCCCVFLIIL